jgi:hypothetical protein
MRVIAILALVLLAGCGAEQLSTNDPPSPPVLCRSGPDCDAKWARAIAWIAQNSEYRAQFQTDYMIQTLGPGKDSASPAYRVSRLPKGGDEFEIKLNGECAKIFGCKPTIPEARALFSEFVNGSAASQVPAPLAPSPR